MSSSSHNLAGGLPDGQGGSRQSVRYSYLGQYEEGGGQAQARGHNQGRPASTYSAYSQASPQPQQQQQQQAHPADLYADFNGIGTPIDWSKRMSSADIYGMAGGPPHSPGWSAGGSASGSAPNTPGVGVGGTRSSLLLAKYDEKEGSMAEKRQSMVAGGELVLAPELGKEWHADEAQKTKTITDKTTIRGPGLFTSLGREIKKLFEWKRFIFILVTFLGLLAGVLYFVIPRVPTFELAIDEPLTSNEKNASFSRIPAYMRWTAQLNIAVDGRANWIPFHFTEFDATFYDLQTGKEVGQGTIDRTSFPGRATTPTLIDVTFNYRGRNDSDTTWVDFYNACAHKYSTVERPNLDLNIVLEMKVRGLVGTKKTSTTMKDVVCPIELAANSV